MPQSDQQMPATTASCDVLEGHRDWLTRLIVSRTGSRSLVDEVLQEIGLAVTRSASQPTCREQFKPWLCTIAIRQCALMLRKLSRQQRLNEWAAVNGADSSAASRLDDPIFWLLNRESTLLVRDAIGSMTTEMRTLLIKKYVEGKSYRQLAEELGVARHVAEYRVSLAKKTLRRLLVERGLGEEDLP